MEDIASDPQFIDSGEFAGDLLEDGTTGADTRLPDTVRGNVPEEGPAAPALPDTLHSTYTSLAEADCSLVKRDEESGSTTSRCPGVAGFTLLVDDFDARMSVNVVAPDGRAHPLRYTSVISGAFSSLGPRAEWRMRGATPVALIVRVNAFEHPETPDRTTSYLAVARIAASEACVTDRIPPAPDANEAARRAADSSAGAPCLGPRW